MDAKIGCYLEKKSILIIFWILINREEDKPKYCAVKKTLQNQPLQNDGHKIHRRIKCH